MDTSNYIELLIVNVNKKLYVVEVPSSEADVGDFVEFTMDMVIARGNVVDKMFCVKNEESYRCMSHLHNIYPATKIYKAMWSVSAQNEQ